jgi:hypothetical protein
MMRIIWMTLFIIFLIPILIVVIVFIWVIVIYQKARYYDYDEFHRRWIKRE